MTIEMGMFHLQTFDKENIEALKFLKKLCKDETIRSRFQGITVGLLHNPRNEFFGHGFLATHDENFIGYVGIGDFHNQEKCVYLRMAIDQEKRGHSYGKILLGEVSDYIFQNYDQVESIRLKIADDNKASLMTANACGYKWIEKDLYGKDNPYLSHKTSYL